MSDEEIRKLEREHRINPNDTTIACALTEAKARSCGDHQWGCYFHPTAIYDIACSKCRTWRNRPGDTTTFTENDRLKEWQDPAKP